jgi:hypothetical protein
MNPDTVPRRPIGQTISGILAATTVSLLPIAVALCLHVPRIVLNNFTDAVFYLSYARQFSELVLRNGFLYYATRFGGILPDAMSGHLFGDIAGIWILRWTLSALVSLALFLAFRKRYGVISGLLASALWSFNPASLRLACTTYVDSTSVPFLIIGCCLVATAPNSIVCLLIAGLLFGLASSAHLYAAFALVLLLPWLVASIWRKEWKEGVRRFSWLMAGFMVAWLIGWVWYAMVWGMPGLLSPTIDLMRDLGNGQAALWKKPTSLALLETPAWFAPLALLPIFCIAAWKGHLLMRGAACSLILSTSFFWGGDLFGKAYVLSMPFYYSFLLPVTILAAASLCGELVSRQFSRLVKLAVTGLVASAFVLPVVMERWGISGWVVVAVSVVVWLSLMLLWNKLTSKWLLVVSLPMLFLASFTVVRTGMFSQVIGHYSAKDEPVLEIASRLRAIIPSARSDQETTRFWYDDDPGKPGGADRRMIGSFWLHYFGKITGKDEGYVPFGTIDASSAEAIAENGPDRIVIFDQDPQLVAQAVEAIKSKSLPYTLSRQEKLVASSDVQRMLEVAILERARPFPNNNTSVKFSWHQMHRGKLISSNGSESEFLSSRIKWWDPLAEADLGKLVKGDKVVIPYAILSGRIRFTLAERGKKPLVTIEKWLSDHEAKLELTVPADMNDAVFSLRNRYPTGSSSRIRVGEVTVFKNGGTPSRF